VCVCVCNILYYIILSSYSMRPEATSVFGLKLLVDEALSY
jgi:hypothetical protein